MATKDISRFLFQPRQHYAGVRMQQGRVLLDSDFNEEARLGDEERRVAFVDIIGGKGSPDDGFLVGASMGTHASTVPIPDQAPVLGRLLGSVLTRSIEFNGVANRYWMFSVLRGSIYVGGLRFVMERPEHLAFQSDFLQMGPNDLPNTGEDPEAEGIPLLFYLNGWEQSVSAIEDGEILERALGGPDTSTRMRRMRRVEVFRPYSTPCEEAWEELVSFLESTGGTIDRETGELKSDGRLQLDFTGGDSEETCAPCAPSAGGRYLGAENQTLRIMLTAANTFVWAFDNGSPIYKVRVTGLGSPSPTEVRVHMDTPPKDEEHWPLAGRVVEIIPWGAILDNGEKVAAEMGAFGRVFESFDPNDKSFTLDLGVGIPAMQALTHVWDAAHPRASELNSETPETDERFFYLRVWHHADSVAQVHLPAVGGAGTPLGATGVTAIFHSAGRPGDYWIAALRPETPDLIVPLELHRNTEGVPPHGPRHFYTPLTTATPAGDTLVDGGPGGEATVNGSADCRVPLRPITDRHCCTVTVGDGFHSFGDYRTISEAINRRPGGVTKICVRPGIYVEDISLGQTEGGITIEGCGDQTIIQGDISVFLAFGTQLRSFVLRGDIEVDNAGDFVVSDVVIEEPIGAVAADGALLAITGQPDDSTTTIESVFVRTRRRTALECTFAANVEIGDLSIVQLFDASTVSTEPQVRLDSITNVVFQSSNVRALGRAGVFLRNITGGRFEKLDVRVDALSVSAPMRGALEMEGVDSEFSTVLPTVDVEISDCRFVQGDGESEHATVTLGMRNSRFTRNLVRAGAAAWGGVQVLDTSGDDEISHNRIEGGSGHGLTLGSVLWADVTYGTAPLRREGAGKAQFAFGDLRSGFSELPAPDAFTEFAAVREAGDAGIDNVVLADNVIKNMGGNGISVLTVLGLPSGASDIFRFVNLRIERNRIENCMLRLNGLVEQQENVDPSPFPVGGSREGTGIGGGALVPLLPFGGIVLASSERLVIDDNHIVGNAVDADFRQPFCGIFVLAGLGTSISRNRIADNGVLVPLGNRDPLFFGMRAGIAVMISGAFIASRFNLTSFFDGGNFPDRTSSGVDVRSNRLQVREGRALFLVGTGAMAVEGNFLASQGFHGSRRDVDRFAMGDVVFVQDLGAPFEAEPPIDFAAITGGTREALLLQEYLTNNPDVFTGSALNAEEPLFFVGQGGHLLFHDNHVVLDWVVARHVPSPPPDGPGTPPPPVELSFAPVTLISLDHASVKDNQMALRLDSSHIDAGDLSSTPFHLDPPVSGEDRFDPRLLLSHLLVLAGTVDVTNNRIAANFEAVDVSILSIGMLANNSSFNHTSHCVVSYEPTTFPQDPIPGASSSGTVLKDGDYHFQEINHVLFTPPGAGSGTPPCRDYHIAIRGLVQSFASLLYDQT